MPRGRRRRGFRRMEKQRQRHRRNDAANHRHQKQAVKIRHAVMREHFLAEKRADGIGQQRAERREPSR